MSRSSSARTLALISLPIALFSLPTSGCSRDEAPAPKPNASAQTRVVASALPSIQPPRLLFLPDGGDKAPPSAPLLGFEAQPNARSRCPPDMVQAAGFCIDRYESSLLDTHGGRALSPFYHPESSLLRRHYQLWRDRAPSSNTLLGRATEVPAPPDFQLGGAFDFLAVSRSGVIPNGYLNLKEARSACTHAGKRLCTREEWVAACRGERGRKFPYGDRYVDGACNVFRSAHPAQLLHGDASINHLDPRLNLVEYDGKPLLRKTGATDGCRSQWGEDAAYDMVGNLDEWVDAEEGVFVGGFYSRATREGCDAAISSHPPEYFDYSLGTRCCSPLQ